MLNIGADNRSTPNAYYTAQQHTNMLNIKNERITIRDAPIAIFLADSDFFWKCDLPIPIFADSDFLSKNYD